MSSCPSALEPLFSLHAKKQEQPGSSGRRYFEADFLRDVAVRLNFLKGRNGLNALR